MAYLSFLPGTEPPKSAKAIKPDYGDNLQLGAIDWPRSVDQVFSRYYNYTGDAFSNHMLESIGPIDNSLVFTRRRIRVFDPPADYYEFRKIRSENLLARIRQNFMFTGKFQLHVSLRRVSNGLYIVHKEKGTHAFFGIDCNNVAAESSSEDEVGGSSSVNGSVPAQTVCRLFKPYSYTVGLRYIMPFNDIRDVLVYAPGLPLFAQAVFLKSCINYQQEFGALKVGKPYTGLFPFAPHVVVSFMELPVDHLLSTKDPCPSVLLIYEKFAMEVLCDPEFVSAKMNANPAKCGMFPALWCNSDTETNKRLKVLAEQWRQSLLESNDNSKYDLSYL
ncbi:hypothetical protein INT43_008876 [Umbelopsis isabellina]|uniref:Uncharacterized protein n=1 Tax=Mortierella isabellina TaxID=91625 RepID=A0A8H7PW21_MORIS|nr:hypothetical protein INT43_008876 [Umbelopsis isabellina]